MKSFHSHTFDYTFNNDSVTDKSNRWIQNPVGLDGVWEEDLFKDLGRSLKDQQGTLNFTLSLI